MKTLRSVSTIFVLLSLLVGASALGVTAAGPTNINPDAAMNIDNQTHTVPANGTLWYSFDYAVKDSQATVSLVNGALSGVGFKVYTADQLNSWWDTPPVGQGTQSNVNSNDLSWVGMFNTSGTIYVQVVNNNSVDTDFQLTIAGDGIVMNPGSSTSSTSSNGSSGSTTTTGAGASSVPANGDPYHAAFIDSTTHTLSEDGALWYKFNYNVTHSQVSVDLPNGTNGPVAFEVYTPDQISDWWELQPVGRGTAQTISCATGAPDTSGACQASDLTWDGNFNTNGTYYVRVINLTANPASFQLVIAGDGVTLQ